MRIGTLFQGKINGLMYWVSKVENGQITLNAFYDETVNFDLHRDDIHILFNKIETKDLIVA